MTPKNITALFQRFKKLNPSPTTELTYTTSFELLVSVILSARATDVSVNKATQKLYPLANTPEKILALGEEEFKQYIRQIGLYATKAKNIIKTCKILIDQHGSQVPCTREALEALPGVGRKSANVILNTVFGKSTIAVDTHIFRVSQRLGLAQGKTVLSIEKQLLEIIPKAYQKEAHHWLVLHGRYICKARHPKCMTCPMNDLCDYDKNIKTSV
jgi:endonuclease-3